MFVERFVAVLRPLSITSNSFVIFPPANKKKTSNIKCYLFCLFVLSPSALICLWVWLCSNLCHLTVWPAWYPCLHANNVNLTLTGQIKPNQTAATGLLRFHYVYFSCLSEGSLFIKDCTTMSAEFAFSTFAVLGLATKQGYVRKTVLPSCKQTSTGNHVAVASVWCWSWIKEKLFIA